MRSLSSIGPAYLRHRRGRSLLTASGVVLGVGVLFGVLVSNASATSGFDERRRLLTGDADVIAYPMGPEGSSLDPETVTRLQGLPGVKAVAATLDVAAVAEDGGTVSLSGADRRYHQMVPLPIERGRIPAEGADEVVHTVGHGPGIGKAVVVRTVTGEHRLTVVGLMRDEGVGTLRDSSIRITSLATAQRLADTPLAYDEARADLDSGVDRVDWLDEHELELPGARLVETEQDFGNILGTALIFVAAMSLFIAAFLIYLTLSGAVAERTAVYGTLRALGATRRQVTRIVVREALWLGVLATAGGLLLGLGLGALLTRALVSLDDLPSASVRIPLGGVLASSLVGIGVSVVAAYLPARRAGRLSPLVAMRGDIASRAKLGRGWIVGIVLAAAGMLGALNVPFPVSQGLLLVFLTGIVLMVPLVLQPLASVASYVLRRLSRGTSQVTVMHLVKERSRSAYTLGLILVVIAFGISVGATRVSLNRLADEAVDAGDADMTVLSPNPLTPATIEQVRSTPGVETVSELRFGNATVIHDDDEIFIGLTVIDPSNYFDVQGYSWRDGDDASAQEALSAGGGVLLPEPMAKSLDLERGDDIVLRTKAGPVSFEVTGLVLGTGGWEVVLGLPDAVAHFDAGAPLSLLASITDGREDEVRADVRAMLHAGDDWDFRGDRLNVVDPEVLRANIKASIAGTINIFTAVVAVALLAGLLGLANTLAMSVLQRVREIGVMRALGAHTREVGAMVVVEALLLAGMAYLLALPIGWLSSLVMVGTLESVNFTPRPAGPGATVFLMAVLALVVALVAALFPARRAARLAIIDALRVE